MSVFRVRSIAAILISCAFFSCSVKTARRKPEASHLAKIHDIRIAEGLNKTTIEIEADEPLLYTSFRLSNPDRLVVEMAEVSLGQYNKEVKMKVGPIRSLRPSPSGEMDVTRLEFELSGAVKTDIRPDGLSIVVEVTQQGKKSASAKGSFTFFEAEKQNLPSDAITKKPAQKNLTPSSSNKSETSAKLPEAKIPPLPVFRPAPKAVPSKTPQLKTRKKIPLSPARKVLSARFEQGPPLQLILHSDGKLSPRIFYSDGTKKHLVIDLPGVQSKRSYRPLAGDGDLVQRVRFGRHPKKLRLVVDFNHRVLHSSEQIEKELKITITRAP